MNRLGGETSPYLLQHANNPVHWWPWGEAALAEAKRTNRPILLSVGYAACHWCHVMAHESFEAPEVAALMNELFVNIKVDREERPDVDAIYMQALQVLGEPGGWPLTMFCTPAGEPFWGGTYFPHPARYGRPGFFDVLRGVSQAFHDKPDEVETNRAGLLQALQRKATSKAVEFKGDGPPVPLELLDQIAQRIAEECDPVRGGLGQAPKFPHRPICSSCCGAAGCATARTRACSSPSPSRSTACARAASTIISAAASRATPPTTNG